VILSIILARAEKKSDNKGHQGGWKEKRLLAPPALLDQYPKGNVIFIIEFNIFVNPKITKALAF
jgi:hypothetical protein